MPRLIAVFGATGNQGGSVAKLLLQHPDEYTVRAVTRSPDSGPANELRAKGAEVVQADLTVPGSLPAALEGCWGVFGVTNFYDSKIKDDPGSEEQQGKNLVDAAMSAGVECFIWSTLPSSQQISGGRYVSRIYEGKYHVDDYIREKNYPAVFLYTGNFYENMILRSHMRYDAATDTVEFRQPVVDVDTKLAMLFVERDLSAVAKAVLDRWGAQELDASAPHADARGRRQWLTHRYLYCADARVSPRDILACVERVSGKRAVYRRLETTGWADRDVMFRLYNECGMYGTKALPDENVLALGVELHGVEDFVRSRLLPHLGLSAVDQ